MEELSVLGAGTMGHSIAISAALAGMTPTVYGINELDLQRAQQNVREKLNVLTAEGLIQFDETEAVLNRLRYTDSLQEAIDNATFIIEAIPENLTLKQNLFHKLDE